MQSQRGFTVIAAAFENKRGATRALQSHLGSF
jgi:hypothetical protein